MIGKTYEARNIGNWSTLTYRLIHLAVDGNSEAIALILMHYEQLINFLSCRKFSDQNGDPFFQIDNELKDRLEARLIRAILRFKIMN